MKIQFLFLILIDTSQKVFCGKNHFIEQCQELTITRCAFNDCKVLQACVREDFERHLEEECKSKTKMCDVCDCDLYAMYADDDFR